ncbi:MAG: D-cysteine desulfhydrase family protein, partial [Anaerolineales bacterium]
RMNHQMPPRHPLALLPTPLIEAPRLSAALGGPRILIKRDDMTGFGFGGNKIRVLEYYLAAALAQDADVIVTAGGAQSNHVRATATAARTTGLHVVAVMHGSRPAESRGNLLLGELLDVEMQFTNSPNRSLVDTKINEVADELRQSGQRPYVIPRGGATPLGALGYVECVREMDEQLTAMGVRPDWVALATGSCGTQAGLLAGAKIYGAPYRVLGVTVSRPAAECRQRIERFARQAVELAGHTRPVILPDDIIVRGDFIGPGYGIPTPECIAAIRLVARTEGLFLDPTYTGKGMAGLIEEIRSGRIGKGETLIFLHTGGEPGLFAHPEIGHKGAYSHGSIPF